MAGNYEAMIQGMARSADTWGYVEEAKRLRALLQPQPLTHVTTEPVYTPGPVIDRQRKQRKSPLSHPSAKSQ